MITYLNILSKRTVLKNNHNQEKGYSLSAQEKLLRKYAKDEGFEIVEFFREAMSAKKSGRKQFNLMLKYITLYPVFYEIIEMNRMANSENVRS